MARHLSHINQEPTYIMNYKEQIEDYLKYNFPKYFFNGKHYGFDRGKKTVTANSFLMYIGSRIASLKEQGVETNELVGLWSCACQQVILSAHKNIEIAKDFRSKGKHSLSPELNAAWNEVFQRELKIHNAKSINELDEKDLINKTYTQFLIYISSAIKNCELFPVNDQTRNDLELLKKNVKTNTAPQNPPLNYCQKLNCSISVNLKNHTGII